MNMLIDFFPSGVEMIIYVLIVLACFLCAYSFVGEFNIHNFKAQFKYISERLNHVENPNFKEMIEVFQCIMVAFAMLMIMMSINNAMNQNALAFYFYPFVIAFLIAAYIIFKRE